MTLKAACQQTGRSESTLRRWIRTGKLKATLNNGKYDIDPDSVKHLVKTGAKAEPTAPTTANPLISQMTKQIDSQEGEIAFLRKELSQQSQRHDTIVLQMTQQLDRAHLQLEDIHSQPIQAQKQHASLWQRLKAAVANIYHADGGQI